MEKLWTLTLIAQDSNVLTGGAGWAGAGLLGLILAWLLCVHLPAKDKQFHQLVDTRDKMVTDLSNSHEKFMREQTDAWIRVDQERRVDHKENLRLIIEHCQRESSAINSTLTKAFDEVTQAVLDLRQAIEERRQYNVPNSGQQGKPTV